MATIIDRDGNDYLLSFSPPETEWIENLAKSMGIKKESIVGAAMNYGLCYYTQSLCKSKVVDKIKDQIQDEIDK